MSTLLVVSVFWVEFEFEKLGKLWEMLRNWQACSRLRMLMRKHLCTRRSHLPQVDLYCKENEISAEIRTRGTIEVIDAREI